MPERSLGWGKVGRLGDQSRRQEAYLGWRSPTVAALPWVTRKRGSGGEIPGCGVGTEFQF